MDIFEQWLNMSWERSAKDRKNLMDEKRSICRCPACSSFNRCAEEHHELLYCITGKSMLCISEDAGCTCRECPVMTELGLRNDYYCMKGGEAAQRYEHEVH